jgi:hypothetical protein
MKVGTIRERLLKRVAEVLAEGSVDDVFLVSDQVRVIAGALANASVDDEVDLSACTVDTAQAARMLSYHAEHVRRLIRQGAIRASKVNADYRIPIGELFNVLVKRHREEPAPTLLPTPRAEASALSASTNTSLEVAIDVSLTQGRERRSVRVQRLSLPLDELLQDEVPAVNGEAVNSSGPN